MYEGKTRITYYDLDFRGNVKLSAILRIAHIAADINANQLGIGFATLHPLNISFVLQRYGVKITRMPTYDETVTVRTWPAEIVRGTFIRNGDMHDACNNKIMEWSSLWLLFDIAERKILKPSALPIEIPTLTGFSVDVKPERVIVPSAEPFSEHIHSVRYADIDTNMHMNNSIYGDLIGNAAFPVLESESYANWKEVQINYLGETRSGDQIKITALKSDSATLQDGEMCFVTGEVDGRASFAARISY